MERRWGCPDHAPGARLGRLRHLGREANPGRATLTYRITATEGQDINNLASVRAATPDPDSTSNSAQVGLTVTALADLAVTKTAPATIVAGTNLTYTLSVSNGGLSTA